MLLSKNIMINKVGNVERYIVGIAEFVSEKIERFFINLTKVIIT